MQNLFEDLVSLLKKDDRLVSDGQLMKNKVVELALRLDHDLLRLIRSHDRLREHFFVDIENLAIFDKVKFQQFVSNKKFLPDSYTAFKNRIGLMDGDQYLVERQDVVLAWPYKDCVLEGGQDREEAQREEVFWNETLAPDQIDRLLTPKVLVGVKRYTKDGVEDATSLTGDDNLIIKGNNLLALHTLMPLYEGKVKLIYIDPPYNTESDSFKYNDRFNHSTWLSFMKSRLQAAKRLLKNDGVIAVQISDKEQAYLRVLMDEIFDGNYRGTIAVKMSHLSGVKMSHKDKKIIKTIEYIHVFSKTDIVLKLNPQYVATTWEDAFDRHTSFVVKDTNEPDDISKWNVIPLRRAIKEAGIDSADRDELLQFLMKNGSNIFQTAANKSANYPKEPKGVFLKVDDVLIYNGREVDFASNKIREIDGKSSPVSVVGDIWTDIGINNVFQEGGDNIDLPFGKKPEMLLDRIIKIFTNEGDLVLDFFAGTGTTPSVAHKLSRKWIAIEQLDYIETLTVTRLNNVISGEQTGVSKSAKWQGGGSFVYAELAQANEAFIQSIQSSTNDKDLTQVWNDMQLRAFLSYRIDMRAIDSTARDWGNLSLDDKKRLLMETLDKNMLYVPLSEMDDVTWDISDSDKVLNRGFFGV